jgi:arsenite/tail-anchored protein-transporting ATPase
LAGKQITVFAGKGGVGKTTCAAATALHRADSGRRTLAISTDPTPSLSDIFEIKSREKPARINDFLFIHELGTDEIKSMWDTKFGREVYEVFSSFVDISYPEFVEFMTSLLPGLGDEFMVDYIRNLSLKNEYEAVIWDTAPLGQTLSLLETPALLRQHLRMAPRIYSRLKVGAQSREPVLEILKRWEKLSADNMDFLQDEVDFTIVTIAEALAVNQLDGIFREMDRYALQPGKIIVNNVARADGSAFLASRAAQQVRYLQSITELARGLPVLHVPMLPQEIKGISRLEEIKAFLFPE